MTEESAFPPEIYDLIIDQLREEKRALSAAALVGRTWLPRCRLHLFKHVHLDLSQATPHETHTSAGQTSPTLSSMVRTVTTQRAAAFQNHVSCNLSVGSYARELTITLNDEDDEDPDVKGPGQGMHTVPANVSMTHLRVLRLKCSYVTVCCLKDARMSRLLSFIRRNHDLRYLSIQSLFIEWSPLNVLFACVAIRAPSLRTMIVGGIWSPDWSSWVTGNGVASVSFPKERKARCLEELCIMQCEAGVVEALLRTFDLMSVRAVALLGFTTDAYVEVLKACSVNLAHLTLDFSVDPRGITKLIAQKEVFEHLTDVSVLQLVLTQFSDAPVLLESLLLSAARGRHQRRTLKHLHLEFERSPYSEDLFLDSFLFTLCGYIPSIQRISIQVRYHEGQRCRYGPARTAGELGELFPRMQQTGMLELGKWEAWWERRLSSGGEAKKMSLCRI